MQFYKILVAGVERFITIGESLIGGRDGETEYVAEVENHGDHIRARKVRGKKRHIRQLQQYLEHSDNTNSNLQEELRNIQREKKECIREFEKRLKDSKAANSDLERELENMKRQKSTLYNEYQEALDRLERANGAAKGYKAEIKEISEGYDDLSTQFKNLRQKNEKITTTSKNQELEIKTLTNTNLQITADLEKRVQQLNMLTGEIARQNQQVNTSAIRDDEYFAREFASLAKHMRNWSFTHLFHRSETFVPKAVTGDLQDAIREIASGTDLPEIFKNRATSRRVVSGLLADLLRKQLFDPALLGLLPEAFLEFENMIEKTGTQKSPWLSQTISLLVKSEEFKRCLDEKICALSKDLGERLGELVAQGSDESKASKRNQKLHAIVERAANLAVEVSQQPYWFRFITITPGEPFNPRPMEDVGTDPVPEEDLGTCEDDCRVSLSVFPCVFRQERVEGGSELETILINRAWVTVETGDSHTDVAQEGGDTTSKEANGGVESGRECPSGHNGDGGELRAKGEGSRNSTHPCMLTTGNTISPGLILRGLEADKAADIDPVHEKMAKVSRNN